MSETYERAKRALRCRFTELHPTINVDERGYLSRPEDNLLDPAWLAGITPDLQKGAGNELAGKFRAVHSSSALAANHFARFKQRPEHLVLDGNTGWGPPTFEKELPTGLGGTSPNLDVFLLASEAVIAVESKLIETLKATKPKFTPSYQRSRFPDCDQKWWDVLETARKGQAGYLDVAQLVKHYLGLICHLRCHPEIKAAILTYLYWRPVNGDEFEECRQHARELDGFRAAVHSNKPGRVTFVAYSYADVWRQWLGQPNLTEHAQALMRRYRVEI